MPHHHHGTLLCSVVVFSLHSYARHNTTTSFSLLLPVAVIFIVASASDITAFDSLLLFFNSTPHFLSSHISIPSFLCRFPPLLYVFRLYLFNINTTITNSNDVPQMLPLPILDFKDFQDNLVTRFRPWQRSFQFWIRAVDIYTGYKVFQVRVSLVKDARKQHEMWERQHEFAAEKIYSMCADLGGFFLKVAQIVGKPDLAPAAWVRRLVTLCDQAPATSFDVVRHELEKEFGRNVWDLFETFDEYPLGSASIAQVHRARLKGDKSDVVVKVQHPGVQDLMMTDIHNLQAFALYMQKTDIKFDLFSVTKEMEKQIGYEFDFVREANAMEKIGRFLRESNKKTPVVVPRVVKDMVTRTVLVMEYIDGVPILNLGDEIAKRGINPDGNVAAAAKQKILKSLTLAYGQMILKSGFFHADPHPGNILICKGSEVALLDYGQVKDLPDALRFGYANLVLAIADNDPKRAAESYRELGIGTLSKCENEQQEMFRLAETMFDTKLPPGVTMLQPFSEDSSIKKIAVQSFPEELFSVLRTVHLLRGLSVGLGINYSCAEQWRPIAEEALYQAGRLKAEDIERRSRRRGLLRRLFWRD
uniref:Protein kinase domain-containing protein n=1 Tax=Cannabis sativa TaxID=3483 RepID=A0A803P8G2_CANSA